MSADILEYAERLVAAGKAASVTTVFNDTVMESTSPTSARWLCCANAPGRPTAPGRPG
ncbi:hypothetical protein [Microbispora bryophytorum]|uniref:Uncharacterized protein n=1 Tax=Microbispora bryophytorum subsp. camponoti TaxID=1677852 RepID=A0ABR8LHH1_9ACTN|nr:hypothetical protein [Microbispora camponoti]MBD3148276.1 hypothetical protein [Microbispora camponoti]